MEIRCYPCINAKWTTRIDDSVNKQHSTSFKAKPTKDGKLLVVNEADIEMAGGLVSTNVDLPAGFTHFGLDLMFDLTFENLLHCARHETDLKITFPLSGGPQANASLQWNDDKKIWQVGANDGSGWVDTPYNEPLVDRFINSVKLRVKFDGKTWGFEGLCVNNSPTSWIPAPSFQNLPANMSGWTQGLHPQLQTEVRNAPWYLAEEYSVISVLAGTDTIPYIF